jgi:2'-5' RNA ligase
MSTVARPGPLHGVVSLLDPGATMRIRETWAKLERELGLRGVLIMPYPHFSYQIAGGYDRAAIEISLSQLADETAPFEIRTAGLATFEGQWPVVYVAVKMNSRLRALHGRVWNRCLPYARNTVPYYHPEAWTPHITLAHGDERNSVPISTEQVRAVLGSLNPKEYRWTVSVENFALVWDEGSVQRPVRTFPLRGR